MAYIPAITIPFVEREEGCELTAYQDEGGVWTIGSGHTGDDVYDGLTITQDDADALLRQDLQTAANRLDAVAPGVELSDNQRAALISFVFNDGAKPDWTIWRVLNAGNLPEVPTQLARFIYADGQVSDGLINRRAAETALWNGTDPLCQAQVQAPFQAKAQEAS